MLKKVGSEGDNWLQEKKSGLVWPCSSGLWILSHNQKEAVATLPGKLNTKTPRCLPATRLHYSKARPQLPTRECCEALPLTETGLTALVQQTERSMERKEAIKKLLKGFQHLHTHIQLNQSLLFILVAFITLDRSPELPSKPLILSHKVYCLCFALHFHLCWKRGG